MLREIIELCLRERFLENILWSTILNVIKDFGFSHIHRHVKGN
jgi:hypothetical protein